jgi:dihydrofolate reductase
MMKALHEGLVVSQIAAMAKNRVIGTEGKLPWLIPEDLKFFREKTKGHICLMGRKTFESVGSKPLPHRLNIVVSRSAPTSNSPSPDEENLVHLANADAALDWALKQAELDTHRWGKEIFIIGGGEIYRHLLRRTDRIYLTKIDMEVAGDAFFPELGDGWELVSEQKRHEPVNFAFLTYERRRS